MRVPQGVVWTPERGELTYVYMDVPLSNRLVFHQKLLTWVTFLTKKSLNMGPFSWLEPKFLVLWKLVYISSKMPTNRYLFQLKKMLKLRGGGYFHQNHMWMCLLDLENLTISIPFFWPISHPSVYHFRKKSTQVWSNCVFFIIICPKYIQFM